MPENIIVINSMNSAIIIFLNIGIKSIRRPELANMPENIFVITSMNSLLSFCYIYFSMCYH